MSSVSAGVLDSIRQASLVVVGSGLFGLTIAERCASVLGLPVVVLDRRAHPGGNSYSSPDAATGIDVHHYGTHIFHTSNARVWEYVSRFTEFNAYEHRVMTRSAGQAHSLPVNLATFASVFGRPFSADEARALLATETAPYASEPQTSLEARALALVGPTLYEALYRGYTAKQWQTDPRDLDPDIISRLPVRFTHDSRYFTDTWQGVPLEGYGRWVERMADHPLIHVALGVDYFEVRPLLDLTVPLVYTGPLDRYFDHCLGPIGWRTLDFSTEVMPTRDFQGAAVVNFADESVPHTRVHEYRHLHPEREYSFTSTVVSHEFSRFARPADEPFYPINSPSDRRLLDGYRSLAASTPGVIFGGRLGSYLYLDMHMAVASALTTFDQEVATLLR